MVAVVAAAAAAGAAVAACLRRLLREIFRWDRLRLLVDNFLRLSLNSGPSFFFCQIF